MAASSDGTKLAAVGQDGLFTLQSTVTAPGPPLNITLSSAHLVITWPTNGTGYGLQQSSTLAPPNWVSMTNVTTVGGQNQITIQPTNAAGFYRLVSS
jgi:hypothetical protein